MKRILLTLMCIGTVTGCAISKDGIGFAQRPPDATKVAEIRDQLQQNAQSSPSSSPSTGETPVLPKHPGFLVIGTTGPLRSIDDKKAAYYAAYLKVAEQWHPGVPARLSETEFEQKLAGWASIEIAYIPLIGSIRLRMLVPADLTHDTRFASAAGSFLVGATGDLVAAKLDADGLLWLDRVLCKVDNSYQTCSRDYEKGTFDENTGQELDRDRKPKHNGFVINVQSYRKT